MELWKKKHESGQWLEVEAAEAMSTQSEFSALNASGIIFATDSIMQKDHGYSQSIAGDMVVETNGKAGIYSEHESCNLSESTMMSFRFWQLKKKLIMTIYIRFYHEENVQMSLIFDLRNLNYLMYHDPF